MNFLSKKKLPKKEFLYEYQYVKSNLDTLMYKFNPPFYSDGGRASFTNWELTKLGSINTITSIKLKILEGIVNSNQTSIIYEYLADKKKITEEATGLISNNGYMWIHPPRTKGFAILELTPFPFIKFNAKKWEQTIEIDGEIWGDTRWKLWKGRIKVINKYRDCGNKVISTKIGRLVCKKIEATGQSKLGRSKLLFYYSEEYGFVQFEYFLINGDKLNINLVKAID